MNSDEQRNGATGGGVASGAHRATAIGTGGTDNPSQTPAPPEPGASGTAPAAGAEGARAGDAAVDEVAAGQVLDGRYRIVRKLGEGGMGEVYAAEHVHIEKRVAVKLLRHEILTNPEAVTRFRQEARSASSIGHENIIAIEDFGKLPDGRIYLCMELLEGAPLNELLEQPLAPERVLNILIQTCHGLAAAHDKGIVHRDMKPENVFVTIAPSGAEVPKLLDFGIAKVSGNDGDNNLTRTGTIFGTPFYMSPEQALGQRVDHRADIYALGVIMYECFTGVIPFTGDSFMGILTKHITAEPTPPSQRAAENGRALPPGIEEIILRAMKKAPEERYQSMADMIRALIAVHRNLVGPGMSSYMEAHVPASAAIPGLRYGSSAEAGQGAVTPMPHGSPTPMPHGSPAPHGSPMPHGSPTPIPYRSDGSAPVPAGAAPTGGYADPRASSQPFVPGDSTAFAPPRRSRLGLVLVLVALLLVGAGGAYVLTGGLLPGVDTVKGGESDLDGTGDTGQGTDPGQSGGEELAGIGDSAHDGADPSGADPSGADPSGADPSGGENPEGPGDQGASGDGSDSGDNAQPGAVIPDPAALPTIVLLNSEPGAAVFEDDVSLGRTPINVQVKPGATRTLILKRRGYLDAEAVLDGSVTKETIDLERRPRRGRSSGDDDRDETQSNDKKPDDKKPDDKKPDDKKPKDKPGVGDLDLGLE